MTITQEFRTWIITHITKLEVLITEVSTLKFSFENIHLHIVIIFSRNKEALAILASLLKATFLVTFDGAFVSRQDFELDAVEVQIAEAIFEDQINRFGADTLSTMGAIADENAEGGAAMDGVDMVETDGTVLLRFDYSAPVSGASNPAAAMLCYNQSMKKSSMIISVSILLVCLASLGIFLYLNTQKSETSLTDLMTSTPAASNPQPSNNTTINNPNQENQTMPTQITLSINNQPQILTLEDNVATEALVAKLQSEGPISINAHDYGDFEKVGTLGFELPTSDHQITTTSGDVMLYQGNQVTIFYGENSWSYTPIGHLENLSSSDLESLLGVGDVTLEFSL